MTSDPTLTEDEHLVLRLHPHWKTLIRPVSVAVLVVAAALIAEVLIPSNSAAPVERLVVAAVAILAVMLWLIVPVLRWRTTTYELTTRRMRVRSGIVTRQGRDIPLARINDGIGLENDEQGYPVMLCRVAGQWPVLWPQLTHFN